MSHLTVLFSFNIALAPCPVCAAQGTFVADPRVWGYVLHMLQLRAVQSKRDERKRRAYLQGKCSSHWPCDKFALKPPIKSFQILKGAVSLPPPQPLKERLSLL